MEISLKLENENSDFANTCGEECSTKMVNENSDFVNTFTEEIAEFSQLRQHNTMVKTVGLIVIVYTTLFCLITLTVISINAPFKRNDIIPSTPEDVKINSSNSDLFCVKMDSFPLTEDIFVNTCIKNRTLVVILNDEQIGKSIVLNHRQWQYLKASVSHIDKSIFDWKNTIKM